MGTETEALIRMARRRREVWFEWYTALSKDEIIMHYKTAYRRSIPNRKYSKELEEFMLTDERKRE